MNTQVLPVNEESIALAAKLLQQGELVALPTETVYGIAADARNGEAVKKIFEAKGRPQDNPLIVHICGMEMLHGIVSEVPERAKKLAAAFWPGPLTVLLPLLPGSAALSPALAASLSREGFAAVRVSSHPAAAALARSAGGVLTSSSANLSAQEAVRDAGDLDPRLLHALDGPCDVLFDAHPRPAGGLPSSIVRPGSSGVLHILREGAVSSDDLRAAGFSIAR